LQRELKNQRRVCKTQATHKQCIIDAKCSRCFSWTCHVGQTIHSLVFLLESFFAAVGDCRCL